MSAKGIGSRDKLDNECASRSAARGNKQLLPPLPNFLLESEIAVVTGGGSGIGRAVALAFAAAGAQVVVLDANEAAASQVAEELGAYGEAVVADVRDAETIE